MAAAVIRVSFLGFLSNKDFGKEYYVKGFEALSSVTCVKFLEYNEDSPITSVDVETPDTAKSDRSDAFWRSFHKDDENNLSLIKEKHQSTKFIEIENEVSALRTQLLFDLMFDSKCMSTVQFWKKHRERLPIKVIQSFA